MQTVKIMKKYLLTIFAMLSFGHLSLVTPLYAQTPRVAIPDFADLVEKVSPAVVNIRTTEKVVIQQAQSGGIPGLPDDQAEFFRRFFGVPIPGMPGTPKQPQRPGGAPQEEDRGVGSGFIIDSNGYVLTNAHVVEGADTIYVTLTDKRELKAKLLGADKRTDVALLKIEAKDLPKLRLVQVAGR